jgi:hypothetical protein
LAFPWGNWLSWELEPLAAVLAGVSYGVVTTLVAAMGSLFGELDAREEAARARIEELRLIPWVGQER